MKKPVIGVTLDCENCESYSPYPWYALRENYIKCIETAGGLPILIPYHTEGVDAYLSMIDGLMIPGGAHDIAPEIYGASEQHPKTVLKTRRTDFEVKITKGALERKMPLLGICGGQQLISVLKGGSLYQHLPDEIETSIDHEQKGPKHEATHSVSILKETLLHRILKRSEIKVNSTHHQAVKNPGQGVAINAAASDGVIEGIEVQDMPFCLGVQWHPEHLSTEADAEIFKAFIGHVTALK